MGDDSTLEYRGSKKLSEAIREACGQMARRGPLLQLHVTPDPSGRVVCAAVFAVGPLAKEICEFVQSLGITVAAAREVARDGTHGDFIDNEDCSARSDTDDPVKVDDVLAIMRAKLTEDPS